MTTLEPTDLDRLEQLAQAATPGERSAVDDNEGTEYPPMWVVANDAFHNPPADDDEPWLAIELHTAIKADAECLASLDPATVLELIRLARSALHAQTDEAIERATRVEMALGPFLKPNASGINIRRTLVAALTAEVEEPT